MPSGSSTLRIHAAVATWAQLTDGRLLPATWKAPSARTTSASAASSMWAAMARAFAVSRSEASITDPVSIIAPRLPHEPRP